MKQIIYQALPRLWRSGKFSDWDESAFCYLKSLGIDILWLTGIPRHSSGKPSVKGDPGSPYAIEDWMDTNPYLADNEEERMAEFEGLVRRAHAAGLKILTDFIPNHVARDYAGPVPHLDICDYDWTDTVKVDYSDPATIQAMTDVLGFWADRGVDGFRCDMVELVDAGKLGRIVRGAKAHKPSLLFVAEVYGKENYSRYLGEAGIDVIYDKSGSYDLLRAIAGGNSSARELSWHWQWLGDRQPLMLNFLENHDEQRIASSFWGRREGYPWAELAYSMLFNTAHFLLYFGQEAGEDAAEGHQGRTSIFNWCKPGTLTRLGEYSASGKGLKAGERSMLARYRKLLGIAKKDAFRDGGNWDLAYCQPEGQGFDQDRHSAFLRFSSRETWLVFCNYSLTTAKVRIHFPEELSGRLYRSTEAVEVPAQDFLIIKL